MSILLISQTNKQSIYCDIKGNVNKPGVYEIKENYTINDVIKEAGGLKDNSYTNKINNKDDNLEPVKYDTSCINKNSLNIIKDYIKDNYEDNIIECKKDGLLIMLSTTNDIDFNNAEKDIIKILNYLTENELNNKIMISYEKYNTSNDFYLYGEKEKNSDVINWTSEYTPIKSTKIKTDNSSNEVNSKTTKPITSTIKTTQTPTTTTTSKKIIYPININNCSVEDLLNIKGLGEIKAKKIIEYRETNGLFTDIEDIKNVSGIGDVLFNKIKEFIAI